MRIGFDIMGGDYAPKEAINGALEARKEFAGDIQIILIGDKAQALSCIAEAGGDPAQFEYVETTEVIGMGEHPTKAIAQKKNSSIAVGFRMLAAHELDVLVSAGNTGAMLVGSMFSVKPIEGVIRPVITAIIPKPSGKFGLLLDAGANADCRPDVLYQFGILGALMMKHVMGIDNPRVGILSIGEEREKGNLVSVSAHHLLAESGAVNFIGNVEGRDFLSDKTDVIVCEGFVGNIVLKAFESVYYVMKKRGISDEYFDSMNYENYGGTPILGVNAPVIIGHGISNAKAFKNMLVSARDVVNSRLCDIIKESFRELVPPVVQ
jgi:glycerol-3-phosphate acyltransferase PlsX